MGGAGQVQLIGNLGWLARQSDGKASQAIVRVPLREGSPYCQHHQWYTDHKMGLGIPQALLYRLTCMPPAMLGNVSPS